MIKNFLATTAVALLAFTSAPAFAQGDQSALSLGLGGYWIGYVTYASQDTAAGSEERHIDILRDTEVHFKGETTLDNGLTVGVLIEAAADMGDSFALDTSTMYLSGSWGRLGFGGDDGAAFLLQVAAPSADANYDGLRQLIQGVNYGVAPAAFTGLSAMEWDYSQDVTSTSDKVSYMSPVFNGFQAGVSYTPDVQATSYTGNQEATAASRSLNGVNSDDVAGAYGASWDVAARYNGQFESVDLTLGGGYTHVDHEEDAASEDDLTAWNLGAALKFGQFGLGVVYTENDNGTDPENETDILVLGVDYTSGPWVLGASWYNREDENFAGTDDLDTDRYSGGVTYSYGPGMTFRGSVHHITHDVGASDMDATTFLLGSQVNF